MVDFIKNTAEIYKEAQQDVDLNTALIAVECCDDPAFYKLIGSYGDGMLIESQFGAIHRTNLQCKHTEVL